MQEVGSSSSRPNSLEFFQDQAQYLVMDFIEGEDLAALSKKRLKQQGPFTCQEVLTWADRILAALEYLHSRPEPIIHRDIKPSNIKLGDDGEKAARAQYEQLKRVKSTLAEDLQRQINDMK